jgi:hypothetical protein
MSLVGRKNASTRSGRRLRQSRYGGGEAVMLETRLNDAAPPDTDRSEKGDLYELRRLDRG